MEGKQSSEGVSKGSRRSRGYRRQCSLKGKSMAEALGPEEGSEGCPEESSCFSQHAWLEYYMGGLRSKHLYPKKSFRNKSSPQVSDKPRPPVPNVFDTECTIIPELVGRESSLASVGSRVELAEDVDLRPPFSYLLHHLKSNGEVDLGAWKAQRDVELKESDRMQTEHPSSISVDDGDIPNASFTTNSKHIAVTLHPSPNRHRKNGTKWLLLSAIVVTASILARGR